MAYKEYDYETLAHLPEDVNCIIQASHSVKKEKETKYLGGAVGATKTTVVAVELFTKTDETVQELEEWYDNEVVRGTAPFTILHKIFGRDEYFVFGFIDTMEEKVIGGENRKIKFTAEILGVSYPDYVLVEPMGVLSDGTISAAVSPNDPKNNSTLNSSYFNIELDGVNYGVSSAEKITDILYITPNTPITSYPTEVILNHTIKEHGLGVLSQALTNDSTVERIGIENLPYTNTPGENIYIELDGDVTDGTFSASSFYVYADGDEVPIYENIVVSENTIIIALDTSRPIYKYEVCDISFTPVDHAEILPFSNIAIVNHSTIVSPEENEMLNAVVSENGALTIANMSIPQDREYNIINFEILLNAEEHKVTASNQSAASLSLTNKIIITDYVSTVSVSHTAPEWGFGTQLISATNNSTITRIAISGANISQDGEYITLFFDRLVDWLFYSNKLDHLLLKAGGVEVPLDTSFYNHSETSMTVKTNNVTVYEGQVVLMSFTTATDIEIAPFTDYNVTNNSIIETPNKIESSSISTDGLTISCTMTKSVNQIYDATEFNINHGYLDVEPSYDPEQSGTVFTINLPTSIRDNVTTIIDHIVDHDEYPSEYGVVTTNNSIVNPPEFVSAEVVTTGTYVILSMDEVLSAHTFGIGDFTIKVNTVERDKTIAPYSTEGLSTILIYIQGTIYSTDTVTLSFNLNNDPQVYGFTDSSVTNNSTQTESVEDPPIYLMIEDLIEYGGFYWLENSSDSGSIHRGKLCRSDGITWSETEASTRYTKNGSLDLSEGYYIDTGWIAYQTSNWVITGFYNVIFGSGYDMYTIVYDGVGTVDIYLADENNNFTIYPTFDSVEYTPPTTTWKIYEAPPSIINTPTSLIFNMGTFLVEWGDNKVSESTFESGTYTPWYAQNANTTLTVESNEFTISGNGSNSLQYGEIEITELTVGKAHKLTFDVPGVNSNQLKAHINTTINDNTSAVEVFEWDDIMVNTGNMWFIATASTMYLAIGDDVGASGVYVTIDNVEVKERMVEQ